MCGCASLQAAPCLVMALIAHPSTTHTFVLKVRASRCSAGCAWLVGGRGQAAAQRRAKSEVQTGAELRGQRKEMQALERTAGISWLMLTRAALTVFQVLWAFCVYLEAVSVLPQLRMMQKAKVSMHAWSVQQPRIAVHARRLLHHLSDCFFSSQAQAHCQSVSDSPRSKPWRLLLQSKHTSSPINPFSVSHNRS